MLFQGSKVVLNVSTNGIYYHDTVDCAVVLINTVAENRKGFTCWECEGAKLARPALLLVGYPLERDFINMVISKIIVNFPVTPHDIKTLTISSPQTSPP